MLDEVGGKGSGGGGGGKSVREAEVDLHARRDDALRRVDVGNPPLICWR